MLVPLIKRFNKFLCWLLGHDLSGRWWRGERLCWRCNEWVKPDEET